MNEDNKNLTKNKSNTNIKVTTPNENTLNTNSYKITTNTNANRITVKTNTNTTTSNKATSNINTTKATTNSTSTKTTTTTTTSNTTKSNTSVSTTVSKKTGNPNQDRMNKLKAMGKSMLLGGPKKQCEICNKFIESHLHKIHVNSHPSQIFKWMYLGTFENACDISDLRRLGVNYILNCAKDCKNTQLPKSITELHLNIKDDISFDIFEYFEQGNAFINKVRTKGGVILVHCKFGVSRSPSFVCAFLMKYFNFNLQSALKFIRKKRPIVNPNEGFMTYLDKYEKSLKKKKKDQKEQKDNDDKKEEDKSK